MVGYKILNFLERGFSSDCPNYKILLVENLPISDNRLMDAKLVGFPSCVPIGFTIFLILFPKVVLINDEIG